MQFLLLLGFFIFTRSGRSHRSRRQVLVETSLLVTIVVFAFLSARFIAVYRDTGDSSVATSHTFSAMTLTRDVGTHRIFRLETGNQILGTFYAVIDNLERGGFSHLWGKSYLDYLLRTPPRFMGLPHPPDLAWSMKVDGDIMAQGGIFELSEAFWNFGFLGVFIIPFLITHFMGYLLRKTHTSRKWGAYFFVFFMVFSLHAPRCIWYQTFSYYRIATIMVVIFFVIHWMYPRFFALLDSSRPEQVAHRR